MKEPKVELPPGPLRTEGAEPSVFPAESPTFVHRLTHRRGVRQFVKFAIVGFSGLIVNTIVFTILQHYTPLEMQHARYNWNYSIGFLSGGVSNYALNRMWTFRASGHGLLQGLQFIAVSGIALAVGLGVSQLLVPHLGPGHRSWFLATLSAIGVNFFINKYWTFREV